MDAKNAYEILDMLAQKSNLFQMIRDEFKSKDEKIQELENENNVLGEILADIDFRLMLGGM